VNLPSFHECWVQELRFKPEQALREVVLEEPGEEWPGRQMLTFQGVRSLHVTGSTGGNGIRFRAGAEMLTVQFEQVQASEGVGTLVRAEFLLPPCRDRMRV